MRRRLFFMGRAIILSVLISLVAMLLRQPMVASAHAYVIGSDPVDGSTVAAAPKAVAIYFNAALSPLSSAQVIYAFEDGSGRTLDVGASPSFVAANGRELVIPLKNPAALPQGNYLVSWTAIANGDGHITYGNIGFNIGYSSLPLSGTATLGPSTSNDVSDVQTLTSASFFAILGEWLALTALTIWIGSLGIEQLVSMDTTQKDSHKRANSALRNELRGRDQSGPYEIRAINCDDVADSTQQPKEEKDSEPVIERSHSLQLRCLMALLIGTLIDFIAHVIHLSQNRIDFPLFSGITPSGFGYSHLPLLRIAGKLITQTSYGILSLFCILLIIIALILQARGIGRTKNCFLAALIALLFVITSSDAQVLQPLSVAIVLAWLKLIAQGLWLGGLISLIFILKNEDNRETPLGAIHCERPIGTRFEAIAQFIALITLLLLGLMSIHNPQQLFHDPYGITLMAQIIITVLAIILTILLTISISSLFSEKKGETPLGAMNCASPIGTLPVASAQFIARYGIHMFMIILTTIFLSILFCSALMSFYAPPIVFPNITYSSQPNAAINQQTKQIGPFTVNLNLSPGRVGATNTVIISVNDNKGKAITDAQVQLTINMQTMNMGTTHMLLTSGNPTYSATFNARQAFSMSGPWLITLQIQRPGQPTAQGSFVVAIS